MPDGKDHEIAMPPKVFSSGRHGYYAQIPTFVYNNEVYGGQIHAVEAFIRIMPANTPSGWPSYPVKKPS